MWARAFWASGVFSPKFWPTTPTGTPPTTGQPARRRFWRFWHMPIGPTNVEII